MRFLFWLLLLMGISTGIAVFVIDASPWVIPPLAILVVGAVLVRKVPKNPLSWPMFVAGAVASLSFGLVLTMEAVEDATISAWLESGFYMFSTTFTLIIPWVLLRFPDGQRPPGRWRALIEWAVFGALFCGATAALFNGGWGGDIDQAINESPLRDATSPLGDVLSQTFFALFVISMLGSAISMIVRYRSSSGETRLQFKWLAYAAGFLLATFIVLILANGTDVATDTLWESVLAATAFAGIPVSIGVAIMKYRLYDIDVVISRTVVLAILAGFITLVYALVVVGIGNTLIGGDSDDLLFPILATAIVAIAFEPLRHRAQGWANRLVYGQRATPYEVLSDLTERLSHGEQGEGLLARMSRRLGDGTGAERATIWLGDEGSMAQGASWPSDAAAPRTIDLSHENVFPVTHDDVVVGAFEVVKPRGTQLSSAERALIGDLAGSAGAVLGYQRLNDSLAAKADELTESRIRLVEAQDRERRRLERDLHDGAQQLIVALKVKIGLARTLASKHDADDLAQLLEGLSEEAQGALDEVRALAKGIYPPVLESDGLGSAISGLASSAPTEVEVRCEGLERYEGDIEAAVYFEISEALNNAIKHGKGPIEIEVVGSENDVRFSVADSGPGFDLAATNGGSGLQNLRDRIDAVGGDLMIETGVGRPTVVRGSVPRQVARV